MSNFKSRLPLLILTLGAILRAATLGSAALWYDESVTLYRTGLPFIQLYVNQADNSGCLLLDLILRPLMALWHLFGHGAAVPLQLLRLPSLLAGWASLWLIWLLMQRLGFTLRQQLFTAAFAACLPGLLWIGQDARTYGLLGLVFLAGIYFAVEGRLLGLTACLGLMHYCHNTGPAEAAAVLVIALYYFPSKARRILLAGGLAFLAWLPALAHVYLMTMSVFGIVQPWAPVLTFNWLANETILALLVSHFSGLKLAAFVVGLISLGLLISKAWKWRARNALLMAWIVPVLVMWLVGLAWNNVVIYRTLMPMLYPFVLWLGLELGRVPIGTYRLIAASLWTCLLVAGLALWRPAERGAGLDQVAAQIRSQWRTGDLLVYEAQIVAQPMNYYLSDLAHYSWPGITNHLINEPGLWLADTGDPARAKRIWLVLTEDSLISDSERTLVHATFLHGDPLWRLLYVQNSTIDVYLVER
jgi:hypothetical protein